jgi:hypothetical protein
MAWGALAYCSGVIHSGRVAGLGQHTMCSRVPSDCPSTVLIQPLGGSPLGDAVERLEKSLDVYNSKIELRPDETPTWPVSEASALMEAWATFETARSALSLASVPDVNEDLIRTKEIERLLEWLRSERRLESLIAERLSGLVVTFGREVLTSEGVGRSACWSGRRVLAETA